MRPEPLVMTTKFTIIRMAKTMMPMTKLPPITKPPKASMTWPAASVPSWPWVRIRRVEARLSARRSIVASSRTVGKALKSSGFSMNSAVIRISTEKVIENARQMSSSQLRQRQDQHDQDGDDAERAAGCRRGAWRCARRLADELAEAAAAVGAALGALAAMAVLLPALRGRRGRRRAGSPRRRHRQRLRRCTASACCAGCGSRCRGCWRRGCGCRGSGASVSMIRSRSTSATVRPTRAGAASRRAAVARRLGDARSAAPRRAGRRRADRMIASAPISLPGASSTARCMVFSSSRTLPGQAWPAARAAPARSAAWHRQRVGLGVLVDEVPGQRRDVAAAARAAAGCAA